jgi:PAS domain S-box-containing protein
MVRKGKSRHMDNEPDAKLRERAERLLQEEELPENLAVTEAARLLQELRVHQIELEMQNEELRQSQFHLEESRRRYSDLYDSAPTGYLTLDEGGRIVEANLTAARMLALDRNLLLGRYVTNFLGSADERQEFRRHLARVFKTREPQRLETHLSVPPQPLTVLLDSVYFLNPQDGNLCRTSLIDITELKQAQESLRNQARLLELAHDAIIVRDLQHRIIFWNHGARETYGWSRQEALGRNLHDLLATRFPASQQEVEQALLATGFWEGELQHRRADGAAIVVASRKALQRDEHGKPAAILEINRDITPKKQAEEALKASEQSLRRLTRQLLTAQEGERQRIALDLHDDLGQSLTALKMQLNAIRRGLGPEAPEANGELDRAVHHIDEMIDKVRGICKGLRPAVIERLGLTAALKSLLEDFQKYYQVSISQQVEDVSGVFSRQTQMMIYRIFQECLTNIARHAGASRVSATVQKQEGQVFFAIQDDGAGFAPRELLSQGSQDTGMGLAAIRQRMRLLGGTL